MIDRFYVEKRSGWFNGWATHLVRDRESDNGVICASTDYLCEGIARIHNVALTPIDERLADASAKR